MRNCPAIFISAPASNQGKTTVSAALAKLHRQMGKRVRVFKVGPDFLDPMILERASGYPVYQLDLWMMGEAECRRLLYEAADQADLIIIEGVMGLYDGSPSSADLAELFGIPIVVVIDAGSMGQTFWAIASGLRNYRDSLSFAGVLANNVASDHHVKMLTDDQSSDLRCLGYLPRHESGLFPRRHLGLVQAREINEFDAQLAIVVEDLRHTDLISLPDAIQFAPPSTTQTKHVIPGSKSRLKVGIARDLAFSFIYQANLDFLIENCASLSFFSPLSDQHIPDCDCLYFPGGYPELYLKELENNTAMRAQIHSHFHSGKAIYAECGGILYMLESLTNKEGIEGKMLGLIPGKAVMQERLRSLGYQFLDMGVGELRGHTFHYSKSDIELEPLAFCKRVRDDKAGEPIFKVNNLVATYMHAYFPSNPQFVFNLLAGLPSSLAFT